EINLPEVQAGSSIMPGKVNPVIPEAVAQVAMVVMGNDQIISQAAGAGNLELNQFMPLIAHKILESIELPGNACSMFREKCISGITANEENCKNSVESSTAFITALVPKLGYKNAEKIIQLAEKEKISVKQAAIKSKFLSEKEFEELITPESVSRLGN
ncbi:MAG: lyase family protein, partial [Prolixibacteraceae bacterium]